MSDIKLWGFDGSTYVRTVKMLLAEKGMSDYEQVPLNVLQGDPRQPEHLARHPFGKVPVLDHAGLRLLETTAIIRYLDDVLPGPTLVPATPQDRARMDMAIGITDAYGYGSLALGVAGFYLFPELVGGQDDAARRSGIENGRKVLEFLMRQRGDDDFIACGLSLAELFIAPILAYVALTPDAAAVFDVPGFAPWWDRVQVLPSFKSTAPNLG